MFFGDHLQHTVQVERIVADETCFTEPINQPGSKLRIASSKK